MNHRLPDTSIPAHHDPQGGYRNPWPYSQPQGISGLVKWMLSRRRPGPGRPPEFAFSATPTTSVNTDGLTLTWIGHSTFLIQSGDMSVLTDPIWSTRASPVQFVGPRRHIPPALPFEKLPPVDAVFISHDHYDHLDDGTVRQLIERFPTAKWIIPLGLRPFLVDRGAADVVEMDWWEGRTFAGISAFCTPAMHFSGRYPWNRNATLWSGWVIGLGDYRVFFGGDTGFHPEFAEITRRLGPFDAAVLPIGAYEPRWFMQPVHMSPEDAVAAYSSIIDTSGSSECVFVPSHWGTFRLTDEPLDEPPRRLQEAWSEATLPETRMWLLRPGETRRLG